MSSIDRARETHRELFDRSLVLSPTHRKAVHLLAVLVASGALAACAQSPAITNKSESLSTDRHASVEGTRTAPIVANKRVAIITKIHTQLTTDTHAAETKGTSYGLASYYSEGTQTASGEQFDPNALTAAHPNLPFGTKLRVTNVATGRSVIVRVNDRGPFVPGRVVDVSSSAAVALGIVGRGTAKVKLDVVQ